jgi:bifunctional ADP-heptose synthase (sugar kinase/adenylyltransferase)
MDWLEPLRQDTERIRQKTIKIREETERLREENRKLKSIDAKKLIQQIEEKTMKTPVIVAQCPVNYTKGEREEIQKIIETALQTNGIIIIPEGVNIMTLPFALNN